MDARFENLVKEILWKALCDSFDEFQNRIETDIETWLQDLKVGEISSNPLIVILEKSPDLETLTFLVRGRVPLFSFVDSVFMRIEIVISTDFDLTSQVPIKVVEWRTVIGDLKISSKNVFEATIALGRDKEVWSGRGALLVIPAGFGLDISIGGISDRGAMIGIDVDLPVPIPLGNTGLGLVGAGGDFAYNFVPRLELHGVPISDPTAKDYVAWAKGVQISDTEIEDTEISQEPEDRWIPGPIDKTAVGIGISADLCTIADCGYAMILQIGLAVLTPGPVFILGGKGELLRLESAQAEGYFVVDIPSKSLAMNLSAILKIPSNDKPALVDAKGQLDAFFSFNDQSNWFINLGSENNPVNASILLGVYNAEAFLMMNSKQMRFGIGFSYGNRWSWSVLTLVARAGMKAMALINWNPMEFEGALAIYGEIGVKIWKFKFLLTLLAKATGYTPKPTKIEAFDVEYSLDLPWPLDSKKGKKLASFNVEDLETQIPSSPFLLGESHVTWEG